MSAGPVTAPQNPLEIVRSRSYISLLVISAGLGVPISCVAYGFLALVSELQSLLYEDLPKGLGFSGTPDWWAVPLLAVAARSSPSPSVICPERAGTSRPKDSRPAVHRR